MHTILSVRVWTLRSSLWASVAQVSSAKEQYFSDLQQLQQIEADQDKQKRIAKEQQDTAEQHLVCAHASLCVSRVKQCVTASWGSVQKANMPGVGKLLVNMLAEDMEGEKLTLFHDFDDALEE